MNEEFSESSFVKARLLQKPIYLEDKDLWEALQRHGDEIAHYFRQIGQELVNNLADGYAFLRQIKGDQDQRVPRLAYRRPLSYEVTLILVCLREEIVRHESTATDSDRIVKSREELYAMVSTFLPWTTNEIKDAKAIDNAIQKLVDLGFLSRLELAEREAFELMRIIKARITPDELNQIKDRLMHHADPDV